MEEDLFQLRSKDNNSGLLPAVVGLEDFLGFFWAATQKKFNL